MEILNFLSNSEIVSNFNILDFKQFEDGFYIKIKVFLKNDTLVFIKEYVDTFERNYSYHWQNKKDELIVRWDNAPHHKHLITYPHHYHKNNEVFESFDINYISIFKVIEKSIDIKEN